MVVATAGPREVLAVFGVVAGVVAAFTVLLATLEDLLGARAQRGPVLAAWVGFVLCVPVLGCLVYLAVHGEAMLQRHRMEVRLDRITAHPAVRQDLPKV